MTAATAAGRWLLAGLAETEGKEQGKAPGKPRWAPGQASPPDMQGCGAHHL